MNEIPLSHSLNYRIDPHPVPYDHAVNFMEERVGLIQNQQAQELIWFLEHPPLYTAGTSAQSSDLLNPAFPVYSSNRGGQYTYHGPGQLVCYVMLDLRKRKNEDLKKYILQLETWCQRALLEIGLETFTVSDRVGLWVKHENQEKKVAAFGVRVSRWVTWHGFSLNISPDLSHFSGIIPCGLREYGVTSLKQLGYNLKIDNVTQILLKTCHFSEESKYFH